LVKVLSVVATLYSREVEVARFIWMVQGIVEEQVRGEVDREDRIVLSEK
jgi:hypothetical protein